MDPKQDTDPLARTALEDTVSGQRRRPDPALEDTAAPGGSAAGVLAGNDVAAAGGRIGRFVVLDRLGQGAMGIVLAAYDADLDRRVAIKLLKPGAAGDSSSQGTERLLREARAMAKLSHPNVLAVHEVGTIGDQIFLAMEFAAGGTLRAWSAAKDRSWREAVALFSQAGRGLEAAHQAALVHRDFKPENVLLTRTGDVRVADFGLVGVHDREPTSGQHDLEVIDADANLEVTLTRTGTLLGTPAYMAPEQHAGQAAGPAADQFAFCVALWEALYGARPFTGATYRALVASVTEGTLAEPPTGHDVPAWLQQVVRRGLSPKPADRWPSMAALIAALGRDPILARRRRLQRGGLIAGAAMLTGLAIFGLSRKPGAAADTRCLGMDEKLAGVWDPPRAAAVRGAFAATRRPHARDVYDRVAGRLDGYTRDWTSARVAACEATHVRGDQSDELLDLRMACLDRHLAEVAALVDVFADGPNPEVLDRAVAATGSLTPLDDCADADALKAIVPRPTDAQARAEINAVRDELAKAQALQETGQNHAAVPIARAAADRAGRTGYAPLLANALTLRGRLEQMTGAEKAAETTYQQALLAAAEAHDDKLVAQIWLELVFTVGIGLRRLEDALRMRPGAEAALRRAGVPPEIDASLWLSLGSIHHELGRYDEAAAFIERSVALREQTEGSESSKVAGALDTLAKVRGAQGKLDVAHRLLARAHAIREKAFGPNHPVFADSLISLARMLDFEGHFDEAAQHFQRAIGIMDKALGPEDPGLARPLELLATTRFRQAKWDEALRSYRRALALLEKTRGPDHDDVARLLIHVGNALLAQGRSKEALPYYMRALSIYERTPDRPSPQMADVLNNLGLIFQEHGEHGKARPMFERAAAHYEKLVGPAHVAVANALNGLAETLLALGLAGEARATAERALRINEAGDAPPFYLAESRFMLARALSALGRDRQRSLALARQARTAFGEAGGTGRKRLLEANAWLRARGQK